MMVKSPQPQLGIIPLQLLQSMFILVVSLMRSIFRLFPLTCTGFGKHLKTTLAAGRILTCLTTMYIEVLVGGICTMTSIATYAVFFCDHKIWR
jgi:hypothetical protein